MYKYILISLILLTANSISAQNNQRFEKIKAHKIAYITDKLELTSQEAEKFWPVYNQFEKKLHQLIVVEKRKLIEKVKNKGGIAKLSNSEAEKMIVQINENRQKVYATEKEKFDKLKLILPAKKILKLHVAEKSFKKELLQRLQNHRRKNTNKPR